MFAEGTEDGLSACQGSSDPLDQQFGAEVAIEHSAAPPASHHSGLLGHRTEASVGLEDLPVYHLFLELLRAVFFEVNCIDGHNVLFDSALLVKFILYVLFAVVGCVLSIALVGKMLLEPHQTNRFIVFHSLAKQSGD